MILGADLAQNGPLGMTEEVDEELVTCGLGQANGLGLPVLFEFDEKEVVAELGLGQQRMVRSKVLMDQPQLTVVRVTRSIGVVA